MIPALDIAANRPRCQKHDVSMHYRSSFYGNSYVCPRCESDRRSVDRDRSRKRRVKLGWYVLLIIVMTLLYTLLWIFIAFDFRDRAAKEAYLCGQISEYGAEPKACAYFRKNAGDQ